MTDQPEGRETLLGFLALYQTSSQDGYLGAILISNLQGVPQEFRCTHPVKPTVVQKPLYGQALRPHIGVKLCGIPLIESIQIKPSLLVVHEEFMLDVRPSAPCPVVFIHRSGEPIEVALSSSPQSPAKRQRIDCPSGKFQPITLAPCSGFDEDVEAATKLLRDTFDYLDPLEPFARMEKAIEVLAKQDKRFQ